MGTFIPYSVNTGKYNMGFDEELLENAIIQNSTKPVLRFYGWTPACVSLGRNQDESQINSDYCKENGIDIVRRLTGGRALLHDCELTYSFITHANFLNEGNSVRSSYKEISGALIEGFKLLGIELSFPKEKKVASKFEYCMSISTGADLSYEGKKLIGSAQFRKKDYILQHGSVLYRYDKEKIKKIFNEEVDDSKIITLDEIKTGFNLEELTSALKTGFENYFKINLR